MSKLDELNTAKRALSDAKSWVAKIGAKYHGGGGGYGQIVSLGITAQVYYQWSNGDNNYHDVPRDLGFAIAKTVKDMQTEIIAKAMTVLDADVKAKAAAAAAEYAELLALSEVQP